MKIVWMWKIGLEKGCNLKRVWELVGLMMLCMIIVDEWLGSEDAAIVVGVLINCLFHMTFVCCLVNYCWSVRW